MYNVLLIVQIIAVIVCMMCTLLLFFQRETKLTKLMLVTVICGLMQNFGYLFEMTAKNLEEAMTAIKIEYIGGSFVALMLTLFIFTYSEVKMPKFFWVTWFLLCCIVLVSVVTYQSNPLYYASVEFVETGLMPHAILHKGPLYIFFAGTMYAALVSNCIISVWATRRAVEQNRKANFRLLTIMQDFPSAFIYWAFLEQWTVDMTWHRLELHVELLCLHMRSRSRRYLM